MKKNLKNRLFNKNFLIGASISLAIILIIFIMVIVQLNKKIVYIPDNSTKVNKENIQVQVKKILDNETINQRLKEVYISFNDLKISADNNVSFIFNCTDKLNYQKEHEIIYNLANRFFNELPDAYGKNAAKTAKIEIISGANCQYREGFTISKGYLGTMIVG